MEKFHRLSMIILALFVSISLIYIPFSGSQESTTDLPSQLEDINVLALVGSNVGDNFLDVRDTLESWNCTVTTIGRSSPIFTHGGTSVNVDLSVNDFNVAEEISNYDFLFVPSGAWWAGVIIDTTLTEFIHDVYEQDILVGSMCVGCGILGAADIVGGKKLLCHPNSAPRIVEKGGTYVSTDVTGIFIISDEQIITGATGSGVNGHENAPYQEFSQTLIKEILGLSYLKNYTIEKVDNVEGSTHKITVNTQTLYELDHLLTGNERNITNVDVVFHPKNDRYDEITVELDEIAENSFEGYVTEEVDGRYTVKIEIQNDVDEVEIATIDYSMWVNTIPGYSVGIMIITGVGIVGLIIALTMRKFRKSSVK